MKKSNSNSEIPKFTVEQYDYLVKLFPKVVITENSKHEELLFRGGTQAVLKVVLDNVGYRPARLRDDPA